MGCVAFDNSHICLHSHILSLAITSPLANREHGATTYYYWFCTVTYWAPEHIDKALPSYVLTIPITVTQHKLIGELVIAVSMKKKLAQDKIHKNSGPMTCIA